MSLPCQAHGAPCPFLDKSGKPSSWTCCGERGKVRQLAAVQNCPQINIARAEWVKAMKKAPAETGAKREKK